MIRGVTVIVSTLDLITNCAIIHLKIYTNYMFRIFCIPRLYCSGYAALRLKAETDAAGFMDHTEVDASKGVNSTTNFYRALRQVIEKSDVIIEVLDARDPQSCRNLAVERQVVADGKKLVLLLNKIDLVPK